MKSKFFRRVLFWTIAFPIIAFTAIVIVAYVKQDTIVQSQITMLNANYSGKIEVGNSHLAPFANFPYISIKIDNVVIRESKAINAAVILDVADIYTGFNLWDIVEGNYDIHSLIIEDGFFDIILHSDGSTNLENALATTTQNTESKALNINLKKIELKNIDIHQREEVTNKDVATLIHWAQGGFNMDNDKISGHIDTEFELNVIKNNDTTYFKKKHFELHTDLIYNKKDGLLVFEPSGITIEHGDFEISGTVATRNDMHLDIAVSGTKPSFDMFIAFAPTELIPVLEKYKNEGDIYFNATLQGPITNSRQPLIDVKFGASKAYLENFTVNKRIDQMGFSGHFTNGENRNLQTMEFALNNVSANLDGGNFVGNLLVKNFETPEIDMQLDADFDIPFIVNFLNLTEVKDAKGSVEMKLNFHDIIDLDNPLNALNDLNQAYFAELKIEDLTFDSSELPSSLKDLDAHLIMKGKQAQLDKFNILLGDSDISITGSLSDLPAIVHHTKTPVNVMLEIKSSVLDIAQLTNYSKIDSTGINERIENLSVSLSFNALANAFTEYKHLPNGEFFINNLYADLKNYPHTLHDFKSAVLVNDDDLNIVDFSGFIDTTDFHFNGFIYDYNSWMQDELNGDIVFDITLKSDLLKFENIFAYQGENYVPEDYRHEQIKGLDLHLKSTLHYEKNKLSNVKLLLDKFDGKMLIHPLRFEKFNGTFQYEEEFLTIQDFKGNIGRSNFEIDMNYYLGKDPSFKKKENSLFLKSNYIDYDALSNYNINNTNNKDVKKNPANKNDDAVVHATAFNIYELPFPDMQFNVDIDHFLYHKLDLKKVKGQLRTTTNHKIYIDTLSLDAAGGQMALNGTFNGNNPEHIILEPNLKLSNVDLDQLLFKFENFGQDVILSENIHGKLTAAITGKIRVYPDMIADLDKSEVHLDALIVNGSLENYDPVLMLSDYFGDKDLTKIKFDTLQNHMDIVNSKITIPNMTIESTLGHMDISGTHDMKDEQIDYYVRIPIRLLWKATRNKIFGSKEKDPEAEEEIVKVDTTRRTRYLNLNIKGTLEDYDIKIKKDKKLKRKK